MPIFIRPFRAADMPTTRELLKQLGYEIAAEEVARRFERVLQAAHYVAVADVGGRVVGLLHAFERPALEKPCEAVVQALVVDAELRGRGIGRALMDAVEAWAKAKGLASVALHTQRAQTFYAGLGYARLATSDLMRKAL